MGRLFRRLRYWVRRHDLDATLQEELELHRALKQQELEDGGMPGDEARLAARRELGNVTRAREDARAVWIWPWLDDLRRDLRHGARQLVHAPGFAATAILTLTVGIGAANPIFSVVNGLLLRTLPVEDPERLAMLGDVVRPSPSWSEPVWEQSGTGSGVGNADRERGGRADQRRTRLARLLSAPRHSAGDGARLLA